MGCVNLLIVLLRSDSSRLGKVKRLPGGGALVPARFGRTGVQVYQDGNKTVREYRPPEEVFSADSLASFVLAPVTIGHPEDGEVRPENWRDLTHGSVNRADTRERVEGEDYVTGQLALSSSQVLSGVDTRDLTEVSIGYTRTPVYEPGISPNGEPYDLKQTNIRVNHVALIGDGLARAGKQARLMLDGSEEKKNMLIKYDGQDYDLSSEADAKSLQRRIDANEKARTDSDTKVKGLETENGKLSANLDAANAELSTLRDSVPSEVAKELAFRSDMAKIGLPQDYDFGAKPRLEVKLDAIRLRVPTASIPKDATEAVVDGYLAAIGDQTEDYTPQGADQAPVVDSLEAIQKRAAKKRQGYQPKGSN